jgi:hypothetical protein
MSLLDVGVTALPRTVFVASAWWRDCEPFVGVVALEQEDAERKIKEAVEEAAEEAFQNSEPEDDRTKDDYLNDICHSGVFEEPIANLSLSSEQQDDLNRDGYAYLDTP